MSAADRVTKFEVDAQKLLAPPLAKEAKVVAEMKKLRVWLFKHQDEALPSNAKGTLLGVVKMYHKVGAGPGAAMDVSSASQALVEELLKLPEGKLVTSKSKEAGLKLLNQYHSTAEGPGSGPGSGNTKGDPAQSTNRRETWMVSDVSAEGLFELVRGEGEGEVLEGVRASGPAVTAAARARFDAGVEVVVERVGRVSRAAFAGGGDHGDDDDDGAVVVEVLVE